MVHKILENSAKSLADLNRSAQMRLIKSKNTKPELAVRRALFALGYRYRIHSERLPGKPDLSFPARKKVVFIHGCFWHQHTGCKKGRLPKTRTEYWLPKFKANASRDAQNQKILKEMGWQVFIVWECELRNLKEVVLRIENFLEKI